MGGEQSPVLRPQADSLPGLAELLRLAEAAKNKGVPNHIPATDDYVIS